MTSRSQDSILVDTSIYSLEAIKKAAYKFAPRASILINRRESTTVEVSFRFPEKHTDAREKVIADFQIEMADQDLREIVRNETVHVRNLILAHAFSRTSLVDPG